MIDTYNLFTTYSPYVVNLKARTLYGSLSSVAEKGNIRISNSITLNFVLYVPNLSYDLTSISE